MSCYCSVVVVGLPRHMERNGTTPIFRSAIPPKAAGVVVGTFNCCAFLYHSGILITTVSFWTLMLPYFIFTFFCVHVCMYVVFNVVEGLF